MSGETATDEDIFDSCLMGRLMQTGIFLQFCAIQFVKGAGLVTTVGNVEDYGKICFHEFAHEEQTQCASVQKADIVRPDIIFFQMAHGMDAKAFISEENVAHTEDEDPFFFHIFQESED